ncbi:MAG: NAD+ synthase [Thermoplasmata archaeon]|nr:NAD+ synthase [Thermoplasmata archaeon]MCI4342268.1 NAD+ synthase [Thermoplasmata archaeon]
MESIARFLRAHVAEAHAKGVVLGLSGGIDSALTLRLSADALGPSRVVGVLQPDAAYPAELLEETLGIARSLSVETVVLPIDPVEGAFVALVGAGLDPTGRGNLKARIRMTVLYAEARRRLSLVLGTGNKSELLTGYFTKYGDGGVDLLPLGDLYKTEVRDLAAQLGLPASIAARAPTAGLWPGQTDEGELGITYELLDRILRGMEELRSPADIARLTGADLAQIEEVAHRVALNRHKRRLPPIPKLSLRTVGVDWRD